MKKILFLFFFGILLIHAQNNSLYVPVDIQKTYQNGTRSFDGNPGKNYWQNKSEYTISAKILTDESKLIGEEKIKYYNNSPDSLDKLVIRLYQDISKIGATRDWYVDKNNLNNGVLLSQLIIDNDTLDVNNDSKYVVRGSTNLTVKLRKKLQPNSSIMVKVKWQFKIPDQFKLRMGNYGNGNMFIAYWYPQIAVYDDIDGWDMIDYQGSVEFYNDFNDYDVKINVPAGFVTWATGDLQNGNEVLRKDIFEKYQKAKTSDETIKIITAEDYESGIVTANSKQNEWHFTAKEVPDFSFILSKSYNWDGSSVVVDKSTGRRTFTDVVYKDKIIHYDSAAKYAREIVEYMSFELPGYPFPYSHVTSFCNGNHSGGMETPMMANNGAPASISGHVGLVFHEIAHNYFPFMMGNNERKYAWMDEGWASFYPKEVVDKYDPNYDYLAKRVASYESNAGIEDELPPMILSYSYRTSSSRTGFYDRPCVAYYELMNLIGKEKFKEAMLEYINRWKSKHPIPLDFFNTISVVTKQDLSWFWKPWFYEFGYPDLAIKSVKEENNETKITVEKVGNIPTRMKLTVLYNDDSSEIIEKSAEVWAKGNNECEVKLDSNKGIKKILLGDNQIPDINKNNNLYSE